MVLVYVKVVSRTVYSSKQELLEQIPDTGVLDCTLGYLMKKYNLEIRSKNMTYNI
jgi:hypothetical protein